jgi:hypothetical protein
MTRVAETDHGPNKQGLPAVMRHIATFPPVGLGKLGNFSRKHQIIFFLPISWSRSFRSGGSCVKKNLCFLLLKNPDAGLLCHLLLHGQTDSVRCLLGCQCKGNSEKCFERGICPSRISHSTPMVSEETHQIAGQTTAYQR